MDAVEGKDGDGDAPDTGEQALEQIIAVRVREYRQSAGVSIGEMTQ